MIVVLVGFVQLLKDFSLPFNNIKKQAKMQQNGVVLWGFEIRIFVHKIFDKILISL